MLTIVLHLSSEEAVIGEVEELPQKNDTLILIKNPRRKDGKDITYLDQNVTSVIWPVHKLTLIEVLPGVEEEKIISFVRE